MKLARITFALCLAVPYLASAPVEAQNPSPARGGAGGPEKAPETAKSKAKAEASKKLEARRAAIRDRIQRERARRRSQEVVRTHVRVRVKLRNGERLNGIVKNGRFVERPSGGLEFSRAEMTQKDAGLRLWYYNNADGYMFLPYKWIKTYKVLQRLTDVEIKVIRDEIKDKERSAKEQAFKRLEKLKDKAAAMKEEGAATEKLDALANSLAKKKAEEAENARLLALVEEYPPAEGWGEDRINQINVRRLTINVFPNAKERRFIDIFEDWKKGRDIWVAQKKKDGSKSGGASTKGKTGSDSAKTKSAKSSKDGASDYGKSGSSKSDAKSKK